MSDNSKETVEKVCRSCGSKSGPFTSLREPPIYRHDMHVTYAEVVNMEKKLEKVLKDDGSPALVCYKCHDILLVIYECGRHQRLALGCNMDAECTASSKPAESVKVVKCDTHKNGAEPAKQAAPKIVCRACRKEFLSGCGLSRHFQRNECDKRTNNYRSSLDEEPSVLPFPCNKCDKDFATERNRNKHMYKVHLNRNKNEPNPEPVEEPKTLANDPNEQTTNKKKKNKKRNKNKNVAPTQCCNPSV